MLLICQRAWSASTIAALKAPSKRLFNLSPSVTARSLHISKTQTGNSFFAPFRPIAVAGRRSFSSQAEPPGPWYLSGTFHFKVFVGGCLAFAAGRILSEAGDPFFGSGLQLLMMARDPAILKSGLKRVKGALRNETQIDMLFLAGKQKDNFANAWEAVLDCVNSEDKDVRKEAIALMEKVVEITGDVQ